jgi:hypothetical protein
MEVINFLYAAVTDVSNYIAVHPIYFGVALSLLIVYTIITICVAWKSAREYKMILAKALYMAITLIGCVFMYPISIVFIFVDEMVDLDPSIISGKFLIECIVVITLYSILEAVVDRIALGRKGLGGDAEEKAKILGHIVYGAICTGVTVLFIYTNAEFALQNWGFSLFGKQLGQWVFNGYLAAILSFLFNLAQEVMLLPFMAIFGSPYAHLNQLMEDD